jgi:hypothetical protein
MTIRHSITCLSVAAASCILSLSTDAQEPQAVSDKAALRIDAADYDNLQDAFDALPEGGGIVSIPPGVYDITEPLRIHTAETRISGAGASTHIRNLNIEGKPALVLEPEKIADDAKLRLWRVQVDNLRISGSEKSGDGIQATGIQEIFLHGISIDHHGGHGISLTNCYEDPRVADSILTYNKKAGLFISAGHDIVVNANHFEENQDALICVDSFNLTFNANNLDDHLGNGVIIENTYGSVVSGNMIEECNGTAIILDRDCYGITLSSNVIAHDMTGGIDLRDAHGCTVSANTFTLVHEFAVRVADDSGRITITGNTFSNSHIGPDQRKRPDDHEKPIQRDAAQGVLLEDTEHVVISGNTFSGLDGVAVEGRGTCRALSISGNIVTDFNRRDPNRDNPDKAARPAIDFSETPAESIIEKNIIDRL